jgi:hypothetical protein
METQYIRVSGDGTSDFNVRAIVHRIGGRIVHSKDYGPFEWAFYCTNVDPQRLRTLLHESDLGSHCSKYPRVEVVDYDPVQRMLESDIERAIARRDKAYGEWLAQLGAVDDLREQLARHLEKQRDSNE